MDNEFNVNPYIELSERCKHLEKVTKEIESENLKFHDEFLKIFIPDQTAFDELKDRAKQLQLQTGKTPFHEAELDKIYLQMAMIYKKWLPIEQMLIAKNPHFLALFKALKFMLHDMEKKNDGKAKKTEKDSQPKRTRRTGTIKKKGNGD